VVSITIETELVSAFQSEEVLTLVIEVAAIAHYPSLLQRVCFHMLEGFCLERVMRDGLVFYRLREVRYRWLLH
jgi:hypothetical protein